MSELGQKIHLLLKRHNLESPMVFENIERWGALNNMQSLEDKMADFLLQLGFDLSNDSLAKTPARVVQMFINELFYGLNYANFPEISTTINEFAYTTPIWSQGVTVHSTCEHHLVGIRGVALIGYIPEKTIVGLSKLNQVMDFFARRPQVQERLNRQVFIVLQEILQTKNVAVAINAIHNCIVARGARDSSSKILTLETGGLFTSDPELKTMFYNLASSQ